MGYYVIPDTYQDKTDLLWILFTGREFERQSGYARGKDSIGTGTRLGTWKLLAPKELQETVAHDWGEYESIGSRIAQKAGDIKKGVKEIKGIFNSLTNLKGTEVGTSTEDARRILSKVASGVAGINIPKYKIDTSTVYQDSKRLEYTFTFNFAVGGKGSKGTYKDVFEPIRELEKLSCATMEDDLIDIGFPAIFTIKSWPGDIINIRNAAITSVQPTWSAPFKDGYPLSCELQVSVIDLEPLYRKTFEGKGKIKTS